MDSSVQIIVSGLTLGAMYALSAAALSLIWGTLNLLNMAQGAMLTAGAYAALGAVSALGLPVFVALPAAGLVGAGIGAVLFWGVVRPLIGRPEFETATIIATMGLAIVLEDVVQKIFGAYPFAQPFRIDGSVTAFGVNVPLQNLLILAVGTLFLLVLGLIVSRTSLGRAVRATAQNREAALLMGIPVERVFALVVILSGVFAALSGVLLSSITTLTPTMGYDPMIKAFVICVVAGLGSMSGTLAAALLIGLLEAAVQYTLGVRYGLPVMLTVVVATLIWRPSGLFGRRQAVRL